MRSPLPTEIEQAIVGSWQCVDGRVHVSGDVDLSALGLERLPVVFGLVSGFFYCSDNPLITLAGAPTRVGGDFYCTDTLLTTLEGAPEFVGGDFFVAHNRLLDVKGSPREVGGSFN